MNRNLVFVTGACALMLTASFALTDGRSSIGERGWQRDIRTPAPIGASVLTDQYGWEDGEGTAFGRTGSICAMANVGPDGGITPYEGDRMLRVTESPHTSGGHQVWIAFIEHLEEGDEIYASFRGWDDTPGPGPSLRIWAHYAQSGDPTSFAGSAGGNNDFSEGTGWDILEHTWIFDSDGGTRDALMIEARIYSTPANCEECSTDYYIDDVQVQVTSANPNASISFPDSFNFDFPEECEDPPVCDDPDVTGDFDWQDGESTILGSFNNLTEAANVGAENGITPVSGDRMLRLTERPHLDNTPEAHIAFIENLQDGDVVTASFWAYDDTPGEAPSMRIWGHYGHSGDLDSFAGSAGGNLNFTSGIGWERMEHTWTFDSDGGTRDALMVQVRLYSTPPFDCEGDTDYYVDLIEVNVCSDSPAANIIFPTPVDEEDPLLSGEYGWEDGDGDIMDFFSPWGSCAGEPWAGLNLHAENTGSPDPVHTGERSLKLTEEPHCDDTPRATIAYIENLNHGDVIRAGFWAYDTTPGENPSMRIWGTYANSGDVTSFRGSAGGNLTFSNGCGWDELTHEWVFDAGDQDPPRTALKVDVRVFSTPPDCDDCSTDFFVDDLWVKVWSANPNATVTLPDGTVIGDPGPADCIADVLGNGIIGPFDKQALLLAWGTDDENADVNSDGIVDGADLGIVLASYGPCEDFLMPVFAPVSVDVVAQPSSPGLTEYQLFIPFNDEEDRLVNVFNADITSSSGFESGSAVTIGVLPTPSHVLHDPNFDNNEFQNGTSLGEAAGWYNDEPVNNPVGRAGDYPDNKVLIASFIVDDDAELSGSFSITFRNAEGRAAYGSTSFSVGPPETCPEDINADGVVDGADLLLLLGAWGPCPGCPEDINGDDIVDGADLLLLLGAWGQCP